MRLLTTLILCTCALPVLSGCCHRDRQRCLFSRHYQHCIGERGCDDDDWDHDECSPCGSPCDCGCGPSFQDFGSPWTSDCGCSAPMQGYDSFPAPMSYEMAPSGGCNCGASTMPTYQQPTYMTPTPDSTPTTPPMPGANSETYYTPHPAGGSPMPPPAPPVSFVPTRF